MERISQKRKWKERRKSIEEEESKTEENTRKRNGTANQQQRGIIREIPQSDACERRRFKTSGSKMRRSRNQEIISACNHSQQMSILGRWDNRLREYPQAIRLSVSSHTNRSYFVYFGIHLQKMNTDNIFHR